MDKCDVQGSFTASFAEEFPVDFELRNLKEFIKTNMKVRMQINRVGGDFRYRFEVIQGNVTSKNNKVDFKAEYEVDVSPQTKRFIPETQNGKVTLTKINEKVTDISRPLNFDK